MALRKHAVFRHVTAAAQRSHLTTATENAIRPDALIPPLLDCYSEIGDTPDLQNERTRE